MKPAKRVVMSALIVLSLASPTVACSLFMWDGGPCVLIAAGASDDGTQEWCIYLCG